MRKGGAAFLHVGGSGVVKALATVRATSHHVGVVVVLAVVLPSALAADLVPAALGPPQGVNFRLPLTCCPGQDLGRGNTHSPGQRSGAGVGVARVGSSRRGQRARSRPNLGADPAAESKVSMFYDLLPLSLGPLPLLEGHRWGED